MLETIVNSLNAMGLLNDENGQKIQAHLKRFNEDCLKTFEIILAILNQNNLLLNHEKGQKHLGKTIYIISKLFENSVDLDSFVKILDILSNAKLLQDTAGDAILAKLLKKLMGMIQYIEKKDKNFWCFSNLQFWIEVADILNEQSLLIGHDGNLIQSKMAENVFLFSSSDVEVWKILQNLQLITEENVRKLSPDHLYPNQIRSIKLINKIDTLSIENKRRYIEMMLDSNPLLDHYMGLFIAAGFLKPQNIEKFISHYNGSLSPLYEAVKYFKECGLDQESYGDILELDSQELKSLRKDKYHMSTKATQGESLSTFSMFTVFKVKQSQRTLHKWLLEVGLIDTIEGRIEVNSIVDILAKHWSLFSIEQKRSYLENILSCDFLGKANSILDEMSQINLLTPTNDLTCLNAVLRCASVADILQELLNTSLLRTQRRCENFEKVITHEYPAELSAAIVSYNQAGLLTNRKAQDNFTVIITLKDLTVFQNLKNLDYDEAQTNFDGILLMKDDVDTVSSLKANR